MHPVISEDREKAIGGKIYTLEEGLARYGLKPEDIDVVIHTHLHTDHCENDYKCSNAVFYIHEKELETINNPHPWITAMWRTLSMKSARPDRSEP